MADIKDSVVSLETAKRLKEAGIIIDSAHSWFRSSFPQATEYGLYPTSTQQMVDDDWSFVIAYPAPTAEELLRLIPVHLDVGNECYHLAILPQSNNEYEISHSYLQSKLKFELISHKVITSMGLCETLSKMAIWLKETGYLESED